MAITATITGGEVQLTGNLVVINCSGASTPAGASEYLILLRTISEDGKLEGAPFEDAIEPDSGGNATFDISAILDQSLEISFDNVLTNKYIAHPTQAFNIQVQPGERYIDPAGLLVENWFGISSVFQMIKGGTSPRQNTMMKALGQTFFSKYIQGKRFLTPRPWGDFVHPKQPVKLWFMPCDDAGVNFKVKAHYSDNTEVTVSTPITINRDTLYEFNCNPEIHSLPMVLPDKKIIFFEAWLDSLGAPYSDVRRFHVDLNYCERPYFLLFANSLGGIDDVYLSGFATDGFNVSGNLAYRPVRTSDTVFTPTVLSSDKSGYNKWKINSGWKSIPTLQFYRDLLLSKQAWFLYPDISYNTTIVIPVIIESSDMDLINRREDQWNIDIQFIEAHTSRFSFDNRSF